MMKMPTRSPIMLATAAAIVFASATSAQRPDTAQCRLLLAAPVKDSLVVTVGLTVRSFDSSKALRASDRADLAAAIRQVLQLPAPLRLFVYTRHSLGKKQSGRDSTTIVPTISGAYAAELRPDGHLTKLRVVGGARAAVFDNAFLNALKTVSDSGLLPPRPNAGAVELRLSVGPMRVPVLGAVEPNPSTLAEPLFSMRVPALGEGKDVVPAPGNEPPRYPENARRANVEGKVRLRFIVNEDGRGDAASIQIEEATALDFASAVLAQFPSLRFFPMELHGCPLASIVEMPFEFQLR